MTIAMTRNQSAKSSNLYKEGRRSRSLYKRRHRRRHSKKTDSASKLEAKKKKRSRILKNILLMSVSAVGAYLVYSVVQAENLASLLEQILAVIRGAMGGQGLSVK